MVVALRLIIGSNGWQPAQLDLATQCVNDAQDVFKSQGGFACFKLNDEAHPNPCRQGQPGLCQPELFAGSAKCIAELLR